MITKTVRHSQFMIAKGHQRLVTSDFTDLGPIHIPEFPVNSSDDSFGKSEEIEVIGGFVHRRHSVRVPRVLDSLIEHFCRQFGVNGTVHVTSHRSYISPGQRHRDDGKGQHLHWDGGLNEAFLITMCDMGSTHVWRGQFPLDIREGHTPARDWNGKVFTDDMPGKVELRDNRAYLLHPFCLHQSPVQSVFGVRSFFRIGFMEHHQVQQIKELLPSL